MNLKRMLYKETTQIYLLIMFKNPWKIDKKFTWDLFNHNLIVLPKQTFEKAFSV